MNRMALATKPLAAFVAVDNLDEARRFYGDVLGLPMTEEAPFAYAFDVSGTSLRITYVDDFVANEHTIVGWSVDDIERTVDALTDQGVSFERYNELVQDPHGIWAAPDGSRVAWFKDPSGNTLCLQDLADMSADRLGV